MTKPALLLAALTLLLPTAPAVAVAPRSWTVESARDFLAGEAEGIRMEADGGIAPALERSELARIAGEAIALSVARAPGGDLWVGTGFAGGIYRIPARGGAAERVARLPGGGGVFALAVGSAGEVYAAASPGGKVFRVDPKGTKNGEPVLVFDSGERYVWAIAVEKGGS